MDTVAVRSDDFGKGEERPLRLETGEKLVAEFPLGVETGER